MIDCRVLVGRAAGGTLSLILALTISPVSVAEPVIYWSDNDVGTLNRVSADGTGSQVILVTGNSPNGIAHDPANGKIYWTDFVNNVDPDRRIRRANLDGTNTEDVLVNTDGIPGVAIDLTSDKVYWSDGINDRIRRANLDGTAVETIVSGNLESPFGIALDLVHGKVYWTDFQLEKIERANLDGTDRETILEDAAYTLTLDVDNETIYVADFFGSRIYSLNFDGSGQTDLVTSEVLVPRAVALFGGKMYWTDDHITNRIRRSNLDGTAVETVFDIGLGSGPTGIFVVPEPSTLVLAILALLTLITCRRRRQH